MIIRGRNFINLGGGNPPITTGDTISITVNFASQPVDAKSSFATMKYNKKAGFIICKDDGANDDYSIGYAYLKGGIPAKDGVTYDGIYATDGTGNQIPYRISFAITTNISHEIGNGFGATTWNQYNTMAQDGFTIANHSHDHGGFDIGWQVKQAEIDIYNNTGQRPTTLAVPTNDRGFANVAPALGYLMVASQGAWDDFVEQTPTSYGIYWGGKLNTKTFNRDKLLFNRMYAGEGVDADLVIIRQLIDDVISLSKSGNANYMGHWIHHNLTNQGSQTDFSLWRGLIGYIKNHPDNQDSVWMPTMQEFIEYYQVKDLLIKSESVSGNQLTITLDTKNIPNTNSLRDISLLVSGGTIASIQVSGADSYTYNATTGLINIYKKNLNIADPNLDVMPAKIVSANKSGNSVLLSYDKPVTQTVFSNTNGAAYDVSNNTITSVTGSGVNWSINCSSVVSAGAKFDYLMQRGNATDSNGMKVLTYTGYPIL